MIDSKANHHVPVGAKTLGMWLFLAALTMLFAATLLCYFIIRMRGRHAGEVHMPPTLLLSTACMLLGSFTIHRAIQSARREQQGDLRRDLAITCILATVFLVIQTPAMIGLLRQHQHLATQNIHVYGLIFVVILIHALHVLGGVLGLAITTWHAHRDAYDHENYAGVKHAAMYWHFLDVVWLVMYAGIYIAG